jgi:glycine/serine hydroxymethyltransferase
MKESEIKKVAELIDEAITNREDEEKLNSIKEEIKKLCTEFPVPSV